MECYVGVDMAPTHTGLVAVHNSKVVGKLHIDMRGQKDAIKLFFPPRVAMAEAAAAWLLEIQPKMLCLEDYEQARTQTVAYPYGETAGILKYKLYTCGLPFSLVNPRKVKSYVARQKDVPKSMIIDWARSQGFDIPPKQRGKPGYDSEARGDMADAYVLARIAEDLDMYLSEGAPPVPGHIILDPKNGLAYRRDLLINRSPLTP